MKAIYIIIKCALHFIENGHAGAKCLIGRKAPGLPLYEVLATRAQSARWGAKCPGQYQKLNYRVTSLVMLCRDGLFPLVGDPRQREMQDCHLSTIQDNHHSTIQDSHRSTIQATTTFDGRT